MLGTLTTFTLFAVKQQCDKSNDKDLLFIKESLYIMNEKPELNRNIGIRTIYLF